MPLVNGRVAIIGENGEVTAPSPEVVLELEETIQENLLDVVVNNFPDQLGFINRARDSRQYEIAQEVVRESFPGYITVDITALEYLPVLLGFELEGGIFAQFESRTVDLALNESVEDKLVDGVVNGAEDVLGSLGLPVNIIATHLTGNVQVRTTATETNPGLTGVVSFNGRDDTIGFHNVLWDGIPEIGFTGILQRTEEAGVDLVLVDRLQNPDGLRGGGRNDRLFGLEGDDTLQGGGGNDILVGGTGSDNLKGDDGNDRLIGVAPNSTNPGWGEIDTLTGGEGSDTFWLGNADDVFYDDGFLGSTGIGDFAWITDFGLGDVIQLFGSSADYALGDNRLGTGIYIDQNSNGSVDPIEELIGVVQGETVGLDLDSSAFRYV